MRFENSNLLLLTPEAVRESNDNRSALLDEFPKSLVENKSLDYGVLYLSSRRKRVLVTATHDLASVLCVWDWKSPEESIHPRIV